MTREEAIEVYHGLINTKIKEAFEFFAPELAESEDVRIRKAIRLILIATEDEQKDFYSTHGLTRKDCTDWLEKQKIDTEGDFGRGYDCGYQAGYAVAMNEMKPKVATATLGILDSEKQQEQKPSNFPAGFYVTMPDGKKYYTKEMRCNGMNVKVVEPKPAEWSEEDIKNFNRISAILLDASEVKCWWEKSRIIEKEEMNKLTEWLKLVFNSKSLRPQSKQEWGDEDEDRIRQIERIAQQAGCTQKLQEEIHAWLKSLRPCPSWKPSKESRLNW